MITFESSLPVLARSLESGKVIQIDANGNWSEAARFSSKEKCDIALGLFLSRQLDQIERGQKDVHTENFIEVSRALCKRLKPGNLKNQLFWKTHALAARKNLLVKTLHRDTNFIELAKEWKRKDPLYVKPELTARDIKKLNKLCIYPNFVAFLSTTPDVRTEFFKWALRDNNKVKPFVLYPATFDRLKKSYLSGRIGTFGCKALKIQGSDLTLRFNGQPVSLFDESKQVALENGYSPTVGQVLDMFKNKNSTTGTVEIFDGKGVSNWNTHEIGRFNPVLDRIEQVPLGEDRWWENLPPFKVLNHRELLAHTRLDSIELDNWVVSAKASRERPTLDIDKSHGYLEVAIPDLTGNWRLYTFGKYAKDYPSTLFQMISFLAATVEARIQYPDENVFYTHRQHAIWPLKCDREKGEAIMREIAKWISQSRQGNVVFQFFWENCTFWPQKVIHSVFGRDCPNFYFTYIMDSEPTLQPLSTIFKVITAFPRRFWNFLLTITRIALLSFRGRWVVEDGVRVYKSVANSEFKNGYNTHLPACLFARTPKENWSHGN